MDVDPRSVRRWKHDLRFGGRAALQAVAASGRPRKLTSAQRQRLEKHLLKGARAAGSPTDLWTCPRVASAVTHVWGSLPRRSRLPPVARHPLEPAKAHPQSRRTRRKKASASGSSRCGRPLKKSKLAEGLACASGRKRLFACPSGAAQLGGVRTKPHALSAWPSPQKSLRHRRSVRFAQRDQVRLYFRLYPGRDVDSPRAISFLKHLDRELEANWCLLWDRLNAHRAKTTTAWLDTAPQLQNSSFPSLLNSIRWNISGPGRK